MPPHIRSALALSYSVEISSKYCCRAQFLSVLPRQPSKRLIHSINHYQSSTSHNSQSICNSNRQLHSSQRHAFSTSPASLSGHNRWSKIKHDKARVDASRTKARSQLARDLAQASKTGGPDPNLNSKLPPLLAQARKIGFTKSSTEAAIARGQGRSASGQSLVGFDWGLRWNASNDVGGGGGGEGAVLFVECLTDNKARTMQDLREVVKGTQEASVDWMFTRQGRITLTRSASVEDDQGDGTKAAQELERNDDLEEEAIMEAALSAGAVDVDFEAEDGIHVLTDPSEMSKVQEGVEAALGKKSERAELVWVANGDMAVELDADSEAGKKFWRLVERLEDSEGVVAVWTNVK